MKRTMHYFGKLLLIAAVGFGLCACGTAMPQSAIYILGVTPEAQTAITSQVGLPVIALEPVRIPDYLDSTDLLIRSGNGQVVPSRTGRWGERLSEGCTRALSLSLSQRLPAMAVITATDQPARKIMVDVESFEARSTGQVVLVARWTVISAGDGKTLALERSFIVEPLLGSGDAAIVAAMTSAVDALAAQVATGILAIAPSPVN